MLDIKGILAFHTLYVHSIIVLSLTCSYSHTNFKCGWHAGCPGEVVTHNCTVTEAAFTSWTAAPFFVDRSLVRFSSTSSPGQTRSCSDVVAVQCTDINFWAELTGIGTLDMNNLAASTFRFGTAELNGTVVECSGVTVAAVPPRKNSREVA